MDRRGARKILQKLKKLYPDPHHFLEFRNPYELLVATILSAQTTDTKVNEVTLSLFRKFPTPHDLAGAARKEVEEAIRSVNFYRNKAKAIQESARIILEKHHGNVPDRMEDLIALPGIARKTANVILNQGYNKIEGIVVDTHVIRVAGRLGWTTSKDPEKIENDLTKLFDRKDWKWMQFYLKSHGTSVCRAPKPKCALCRLNDVCDSALLS